MKWLIFIIQEYFPTTENHSDERYAKFGYKIALSIRQTAGECSNWFECYGVFIVYELIANKIRWNDFVENEITCFIMGYSVMQSVVDGGVH